MSDPDRRKPRPPNNGPADPAPERSSGGSVEQWLAQKLSAFAVPDPTEEDETELPTQTRVRTPNPTAGRRPTAPARPEPVRIEFGPPAKPSVPASARVAPTTPAADEPPPTPFRVSDPSWEEPEVIEGFDDGPAPVDERSSVLGDADFDTKATAPMAAHRDVIRDSAPPVRAVEAPLDPPDPMEGVERLDRSAGSPPADFDRSPRRDPNSPPPARVRVSPPPVTLRAPLPSLPPVDEDATEGDAPLSFVRPATTWGTEAISVEGSDLGFELLEPPSSEVTKPSSGMGDAWDLLGESDGRGFPALELAETEERTPPGGWSTPGPAPSLTDGPPSAHVRIRPAAREGEEKILDQLIAEAEAQTPAIPRRRPGAFSRYPHAGPGPVALDGALDEVFHPEPRATEDTRELLSETHHGAEVPWGDAPSTDEATSWLPQAEVREEPTQATDAPRLDDGPTVVPRALPPLVPSPPPAPTRAPAAVDPPVQGLRQGERLPLRAEPAESRGYLDSRVNTLSEQPTADPASRRQPRALENNPTEPVSAGGTTLGDLVMTGVTWLTVGFAILTFVVLMVVVTAFLVPLLSG
ncbi:MAG: hypothetical protein ABMA64_07385 [Myxococcota bacterium]